MRPFLLALLLVAAGWAGCLSDDGDDGGPERGAPGDVDGDSVPDAQDDDVDGDSILNGEDDDIDGDGILNADETSALAFAAPTMIVAACDGCYEPAVAVDDQGRVFATGGAGFASIGVSTDGGATFTVKPAPTPPDELPVVGAERGSSGDDVVQVAPWGWLYYSRLFSDTGGIAGGGLHLAASEDGGETWIMNQFMQLRTDPVSRSFTADRQWYAFDGDQTVYLLFNCGASATICMRRSDDRGMTWGLPVDVVLPADHTFPSPAGFPAVGPDGTILVAYFGDPRVLREPDTGDATGARSIKVAASSDGGETWRQSTAYTHPGLQDGTSGGGWPEATILADGTWVAGWSGSDDVLNFVTSTDAGASWTDPVSYTPEQTGGASHPWMRPRPDGGFDAVWFGSGPSVQAGRFDGDATLLAHATVPEEGGGQSDYSFFDHTADGRIAVAYLTPDGDFRYAVTNV